MSRFKFKAISFPGLAAALCLVFSSALAAAGAGGATYLADYREPGPAVTALLTAPTPPDPLMHAGSGQVALLYREPVIEMKRLARPRLGLAGFRFDPESGISGVAPMVWKVEVVSVNADADKQPATWTPAGGALLEYVHFSPDGRTLSAVAICEGPARLVLFDVAKGTERVLDAPVNPTWGDPCHWVSNGELLCRVNAADRGAPPAEHPAPLIIEHVGGPVPMPNE